MRVRGLKCRLYRHLLLAPRSHPMRVRGLKCRDRRRPDFLFGSHPMRVRGLKFLVFTLLLWAVSVAPHAGAWIEISRQAVAVYDYATSHPMRVRGLKS